MADAYGPFSTGPVNGSFLMPIEDIFNLKHRGIVVTGRIERGMVQVGDPIEIVGMKKPDRQAIVRELEMFRKLLTVAQAGNTVGCLLQGVQPTDLERGQVLASIGSIKAYKKFSAQVQMYAKEEGGRHTPFFDGYRPGIHLRSVDIPGTLKLPYGMSMGIPGQSLEAEIELPVPVALEVGTKFELRESGRTVGSGICTRLDDTYPY
ncbi:MAG TPA: EF-Tu/IF-2/RF-3 family GTPase [Ktedonobacterales bacterium]|nr:EF-Tu/IF-2/RF-3 family GTPase [Ktedonobacterales bacterium]